MQSETRQKYPSESSARLQADHGLLQGMAQGDRAAFAGLYDRFQPRLLALSIRIMRSQAEAEDVLQEAFCVAWRNAAQYLPALGSPAAWLVSIVRHKAIDRLRYCSREVIRARQGASLMDDHIPVAANGGEVAMAREDSRAIRQALLALHPEENCAIQLAFFRGLSHGEIATVLAVPVGTVKARIRRGLTKLRPVLRAHNEHPFYWQASHVA